MTTQTQEELTYEEQLDADLASFYDDPYGYVMYAFPWGVPGTILEGHTGPDTWQREFLEEWGEEIRKRGFDGVTPVAPIMFSTASGHGIGKSALVAWIIKFIMDTRDHAKGVVTAATAPQLKTKTWAELGKWHKMSATAHRFHYNSGQGNMSLVHKLHPDTWRCDAQTCKEENSESFAGLHNVSSTPFYIFDEASGVPDKIFEVREGGLTDGEPMVFDFGNPTRRTGRFAENMVGKFRDMYIRRQIDSRSVAITNKELLQRWIDAYGEDSDFVRVRVKGEFPRGGDMQFIPTDIVELAMQREVDAKHPNHAAPLTIGVDVARFGDDRTVIWPRIGRDAKSFAPEPGKGIYRGLSNIEVATKVVECIKEFENSLGRECNALFVDGGGPGGGVIDILRQWGYDPIEVNGANSSNSNRYANKRAQMWGDMRDAIREGLALPDDIDVKADLTGLEYGYRVSDSAILLEKKEDMKDRGLPSPDLGDALALTYAHPVAPRGANQQDGTAGKVVSDYDPYEAA